MQSYPVKIRTQLRGKLPGIQSHYKMLPPTRVLDISAGNKGQLKKSSVMLLLFEENGVLKTLLTKRSKHMKHHSGEIALPGGKIENHEAIIEAALRETYEETGIEPYKIEVLGHLSDFYIEVSKFWVHPIVGWINSRTEIKENPDEVEKVFSFPIEGIKPPYSYTEMETRTGKVTVPCICFEEEIIWGATAMILSEFYDLSSTL